MKYSIWKLHKRLKRIESKLDCLTTKLEEFQMAVAQDLKDLTKKFDEATNKIAERIAALQASVKNSMTDAEVDEVKAGLQAEIDKLTSLGADPTNPVP